MSFSEPNASHSAEIGCDSFVSQKLRSRGTPSGQLEQCHADETHSLNGERRPMTEDETSVHDSTSPSMSRHTMTSFSNPNPFKHAISEMKEMKERFNVLEKQITSSSSNQDRTGSIEELLPISQEANVTFENGLSADFDRRQIIPEICEEIWDDFMNKIQGDKEYAIEVLMDEPEYLQQRSKEIKKNGVNQNSKKFHRQSQPLLTPERIRINSPWILNSLANIDSHIDPTTQWIVMLRPFKFLVHYEKEIRNSIPKLQNQLEVTSAVINQDQSQENLPAFQEIDTTIQHIKCLIEFIDQYVRPTMDRLKGNRQGSKVHFKDLWYLFRPGEDIYIPLRLLRGTVSLATMVATPETFQGRYNRKWRVTGSGGGRRNLSSYQSRNSAHKFNPFKVNCYYIDFDGKYFCPITHSFSIMPFEGERDIASLDFFPSRYLTETEDTIEDKGKMIFENIASSFTHYYYAGPTLVAQPCGCPLQTEYLHQEHVESEVIVDFRMALLKKPEWRPKSAAWKLPPVEERELQEKNQLRYWKDSGKTKLKHDDRDHVYDDYYIDKEEAISFKCNERIFGAIPSHWLGNEHMVPEADIQLLPARVFAYVLRTRTWAPLWLHLLQPIKAQTEGFRNLQLRDDSFKETVQALVRTHFIQKDTHQISEFEYDMIPGKGKGLVILLHGAPGVGKSFTAESVAAANGKPLFQITCGDLGLTPEEVDKSLKELFRLAQLWNCVLLLDECDIFLTQRSKNEVLRNSLVSVFLKVLEFYTGVLFLTTNRVGVIDDAIKSRITWIAYYPPLGERQTKNIWKNNLRLLEVRNKRLQIDKEGIMEFARAHFKDGERRGSTWNGRQIQNAFKVATSLAEWDAFSNDLQRDIKTRLSEEIIPKRPVLTAKHFQTVAIGIEAFNDYIQEARGYNDAEMAFNNMERFDGYVIENSQDYNDDGTTSVNGNNRPRVPSISLSSSSPHRQRRSSSSKVATPKPYVQESGLSTGRPRSSQSQHQKMSASPGPGHRRMSLSQPKPQSPKSASNLMASTASMDVQLQLPPTFKTDRHVNHKRATTSAAAASVTIEPKPNSPNPYARHQMNSNAGLANIHYEENEDYRGQFPDSDEYSSQSGNSLASFNEDADDDDWLN